MPTEADDDASAAPDSAPDASAKSDPSSMAAQAAMDAIKDGDADDLYKALCSMIDLHSADSDPSPDMGPAGKPSLAKAMPPMAKKSY
jgi:hypothetical protein